MLISGGAKVLLWVSWVAFGCYWGFQLALGAFSLLETMSSQDCSLF